jgi:hypothetical protein
VTFRIDTPTFKVSGTNDPEIFTLSGQATEDNDTIPDASKSFYSFSITFNRNVTGSRLAAQIQAAIDAQKPRAAETSLKSALMAAFPAVFKTFIRST